MKPDIYTKIADRVIADPEAGVRPLRHNGHPYAGTSILTLWSSAVAQGFPAPIWMTYRQAQELGGRVRRGGCRDVPGHHGDVAMLHRVQNDAGPGHVLLRPVTIASNPRPRPGGQTVSAMSPSPHGSRPAHVC